MQAKQETDWINKEKRELFCKFVNTVLMTDINKLDALDEVLENGEKIVNKAFELYPDEVKETEEKAF